MHVIIQLKMLLRRILIPISGALLILLFGVKTIQNKLSPIMNCSAGWCILTLLFGVLCFGIAGYLIESTRSPTKKSLQKTIQLIEILIAVEWLCAFVFPLSFFAWILSLVLCVFVFRMATQCLWIRKGAFWFSGLTLSWAVYFAVILFFLFPKV